MVYNPFAPHMNIPGGMRTYEKAQRQVAQAASGPRAHPERLKQLAAAKRIDRVRVEPTSPDFRYTLKHPNGMAFRPEGSVEWPMDKFTMRRIADGSVRIVEKAEDRQERHAANRRHEPKS
jgi:hypothetical protein